MRRMAGPAADGLLYIFCCFCLHLANYYQRINHVQRKPNESVVTGCVLRSEKNIQNTLAASVQGDPKVLATAELSYY